MGGERGCESARLLVRRRLDELRRAGDGAVQAGDEKLALGDHEHAAPIGLETVARRRLEPAEAAAVEDRGLGGVAQVFEIGAAKFGDAFDGGRGHGVQRRKLAISLSPAAWLFSGWNCTPARLSRATAAVTGSP